MHRLLEHWRKLPFWPRWTALAMLGLLVAWLGYDLHGRMKWAAFVRRYDVPGSPLLFEKIRDRQESEPPSVITFRDTPTYRKWNALSPDHDPAFAAMLTEWPEGVKSAPAPLSFDYGWQWAELPPLRHYLDGVPRGSLSPPETATELRSRLSPRDPAFAELQRDTRITDRHWLQEIPNLASVNEFSRLLSLRTRTSIAIDDGGNALEELLGGYRFAERMREGETLVGLLVQLAVLEELEDATWDGIQSGTWDAEQLALLAGELGDLTITRDFSRIPLSEIGMTRDFIQEIGNESGNWRWHCLGDLIDEFNPPRILHLADHDWNSAAWYVSEILLPEGHRLNGFAEYGKFWESCGLQFPGSDGAFPEYSVEILDQPTYQPRTLFGWALPNVDRIGNHLLSRQQFVDLAIIACELERFRLREGSYPGKLEELERGVSLPADRFDPALPIRYRILPGGGDFDLLTSGSDRKDDGGNRDHDFVFSSLPASPPPDPAASGSD